MVHFVGAGPGAEDLITVRGQRYLRQADVIIYAGSLVNPKLLKEAKEGCQIHNSAFMTLEEVIHVMEAAEEQSLLTVRLHTGDPSIFGAIREQMDELDKRKIPYEVCPGVSSLFGAAASLGLEYTLPEMAQSVIITRAEGRTPVPEKERLRDLAAHQTTMILFLSSGLAGKVKQELEAGGYGPDTPVAVVYKATWPEEKILRATLSDFAERMEQENITKTALIIVGNVLNGGSARSKLYDKTFTTEYRKGSEG
ncbi:MAG: precorrin-4 C(11)-methyltransferase [Lachnospiraceae bacterium]|nr:precorrin-4 C(11)-methyltransferase [Lachnospiraceae bacterium]